MTHAKLTHLSRRERQILDILYRVGRATASDVQDALPDPPSYSAVRAMLRVLEEKGHIHHEQDGPRYVFMPTLKRATVKRSALRHLLDTFFEGSATEVMAALVEMSPSDLDKEELQRLKRVIEDARKRREV